MGALNTELTPERLVVPVLAPPHSLPHDNVIATIIPQISGALNAVIAALLVAGFVAIRDGFKVATATQEAICSLQLADGMRDSIEPKRVRAAVDERG